MNSDFSPTTLLSTSLLLVASISIVVFAVNPAMGSAQTTSTGPDRQLQSATSVDPISIKPSFLVVPELDLATVVESVGVDEDGQMQTPDNWRNASWYQPGRQPGQAGHAVFAAHRDWSGNAGPFFELSELSSGDNIFVSDGNSIHVYTVTDSSSYARSADPESVIFQNDDSPYVTLITCEGQFLQTADTYSDRRVVQAKLTYTYQ